MVWAEKIDGCLAGTLAIISKTCGHKGLREGLPPNGVCFAARPAEMSGRNTKKTAKGKLDLTPNYCINPVVSSLVKDG